MERLADRASAIFVPIVLALAVVTFSVWLFAAHSLSLALANTVAVLVVACPCAMGLAVPAALTVAWVAARNSVCSSRVEKRWNVWRTWTQSSSTRPEPSPWAAPCWLAFTHSLATMRTICSAWPRQPRSGPNHPLAHAVVDAARERGLVWQPAQDVQILPGRGLTAKVEGGDCLLGNEALFHEFSILLPDGIPPAEPGVTRLWMALDNLPAGYFDARDASVPMRPRPSPRCAIPASACLCSPAIRLRQPRPSPTGRNQRGRSLGPGDGSLSLGWEAGLTQPASWRAFALCSRAA